MVSTRKNANMHDSRCKGAGAPSNDPMDSVNAGWTALQERTPLARSMTWPIRQSQKAGSAPSGSASALPTRDATAMSASLLLRRSRFGKPVGSLAAASDSSEARGGDGGVEGGGEPAGRADTSTSMLILPWVLRSFVSITSPDLTQLLTNPEANYCLASSCRFTLES